MRAVLDTSIFIGQENNRILGALPSQIAVSTVTLAELELGVLVARDTQSRQKRLRTLLRAKELAEPLAITEAVASTFAALLAELHTTKRSLKTQDAWIAATALTHNAALCTQDRDFHGILGLEVVYL